MQYKKMLGTLLNYCIEFDQSQIGDLGPVIPVQTVDKQVHEG